MAASDFNTIVVSPAPRGRFINGYIDGTPKPGTVMQIKAATEPVGNRFTFTAYAPGSDGDNPKGPIFMLCEDRLQGYTVDDAYVAGTMGLLYAPLPGDELLGLLADVAGTDTDTYAIGDLFMIDNSTGKLLDTTGVESEPFVCMETIGTGVTADVLVHVMFAGA